MTEELQQEVEHEVDEELLFFRRFPAEKQDQVRALVNYATLMGLNGKDLVSIGGKLDRLKAAAERKQRHTIIAEMMKNVQPIGKDKAKFGYSNPSRFTYIDGSGRKWKLDGVDYYGCRITNDAGETRRIRSMSSYDIGRSGGQYYLKQTLLNIYYGDIKLDF